MIRIVIKIGNFETKVKNNNLKDCKRKHSLLQ